MIFLFIHQNMPGQYRRLLDHYKKDPNNKIYFITQSPNGEIEGVERILYDPAHPEAVSCHPYSLDFDCGIRVGLAVANACRGLKARGVVPDIILGHNGWGEMLFVKDVYPSTPMLSYFEFYYHADGVDVGFDPEYASGVDPFRLRTRNAINLLGFDAADWGNAPTLWQRNIHPPELRSRISVVHEGVDTDLIRPDPDAWLYIERDGVLLNRQEEVITYVARNLEPYRGFHIFMRSAAEILKRRPRARIVVVGGDDVSYGTPLPKGETYRAKLLAEVGDRLDLSRIHFLGRISYENYVRLLQVSSAHVYLTYPFVLSWSFVEALACGCAIVGSDTPPVTEVLRHGENGLLVDFFSPEDIADRVDEVFAHPEAADGLRRAARKTAVERYDLKRHCLPKWGELIADLQAGQKPRLYV